MIRKAEVRDINDILVLLHQVHDLHQTNRPDIFKKGTVKYNDNDLKIILEDETRPIFVYEIDSKVVGYIFCMIKRIENDCNLCDYDYLFIDDLCVLEKYRGKNIGTFLYKYAKDFAIKNDLKSIRLNVWNFNEKAYNFYQKNGMKILEYIMEDDLK